ncbi:MAG: transcription elongation factor GreA [Myxococcales bacterium]|nr:transcription elongation factor GreA [Myxococcales bacterium]
MGDSYPVTKEGYEALKSTLHEMKTVERPKVIQAIAEARAHGDLSENAEYAAAKEKQAILESRIQDYENRVAISQVIDPATIREDRVVFGATVTVLDLDTEQEKTYKIVGDHEGDLKIGKISIQSPLARVMIGRRVGDVFDFQTANGLKELEITKLIYK